MTTTPPTDARPYRRESEPGTEMRTTTPGHAQIWRQIGWHGQSGAFYALDEKPTLHEPGSIAPLWLLVDNDPAGQDDAEVRAAALLEAADELEHCENDSGDCMCAAVTELRRMAAAARPDDTTGAQRPVSLGTPCARCGHARNWHANGRCALTAPPNRCACRNFTPDDTTGA